MEGIKNRVREGEAGSRSFTPGPLEAREVRKVENLKFNLMSFLEAGTELSEIIGKLIAESFGKKDHNELSESLVEEDAFLEIEMKTMDVGFSVGFLYGSLFEIADAEQLGELARIKEKLIKARVLKYFPRSGPPITKKEEPQGTPARES